jgi:hypothetical protein
MGFAYLSRCLSARPPYPPLVTTGHSRSKNGVASLAYDPVVHGEAPRMPTVRSALVTSAWIAGSSPAMTK